MATREIELIIAAQNRTNRAFSDVNKNLSKLERGVKNIQALGNIFTGLFAVNKITGYAQQLGQIADEWNNIEARLGLVTSSTEELTRVQRQLFDIAQATYTEYRGTTEIYTKLARNADQLGLNNQKVLTLTETINQAIQTSGATADEAENGIRQFGQALDGGILRAEEFNSINEQTPRLMQAVADGLGVTRGELRKLVNDGEITADKLTQALLSQSQVIESEFSQLPDTIGRNITKIENEFGRFVSQIDETTGASEKAAQELKVIADALTFLTKTVQESAAAFEFSFDFLDSVTDKVNKVLNPTKALVDQFKDWLTQTEEINDETEKTTILVDNQAGSIEKLTDAQASLNQVKEDEQQINEEKQNSVEKVLSSLEEERELLTKTAKEQFVYNQLKKAGADLTIQQADAITQAAERLFDEREALKNATKEIQDKEIIAKGRIVSDEEAEEAGVRIATFMQKGLDKTPLKPAIQNPEQTVKSGNITSFNSGFNDNTGGLSGISVARRKEGRKQK